MSDRIDGVIKFPRSAFRNDGAQGETVHALCDEVERLRSQLEIAVDRLKWIGGLSTSTPAENMVGLARSALVDLGEKEAR